MAPEMEPWSNQAAAIVGRDDADRHGDGGRDQDREQGQEDRRLGPLASITSSTGRSKKIDVAEIAGGDLAEEAQELDAMIG